MDNGNRAGDAPAGWSAVATLRAPALLLGLLLAALPGGNAAASTLHGTVINGSGGGLGEPVPVSVTALGGESETMGDWNVEDGRDGFTLADLPGGAGNRYFLQAFYRDVSYAVQFEIPADGDTAITVPVYDVAPSRGGEAVSVVAGELLLLPEEGTLRIDQVYRFLNDSDPPVTYAGRPEGNIVLPLPITTSDRERVVLAVSTGIVPVRRDPVFTGEPKRVGLDYPLRPGVTTVAVSCEVSYPGQYVYSVVFPWDAPAVHIFTEAGLSVEGDRVIVLADSTGASSGGAWMAQETAAGEELMFLVSGMPAPDRAAEGSGMSGEPPGRVIVGAPFPGRGRWALLGVMAAILIGTLVVTIRRGPSGGGE